MGVIAFGLGCTFPWVPMLWKIVILMLFALLQGERYREGQKVVWRHFLVFYRHDYFLHFFIFF